MNRPERKKGQRGAAAVETALSLVILTFVAMAGIYFTDAMVIRQRLTSATSRATRVCARVANVVDVEACLNTQVRASLGPRISNQRCQPLDVDIRQEALPVADLFTVTATATCAYSHPLTGFLQFNDTKGEIDALTLRAQASMPISQ